MQTTSSVYQAILQEENYHFEVKLNIAGSDYGQDVIFSMKSDSRLFESSPTIGGTYSGTLEFSLLGDGADIPRMAVVKPYYRAVGASQTSEWLQKGEYYIDTRSVSQNEGGVVVFNAFCYDAMLKANAPYASSTLSWPATPKQVVNEIAGKMGVTITSYASTVLNSSYISIPMPVQYNMREVLGFIAAAYGGNWFMNYEGQLDFKELYMMGLGSAQLAVGTNVSSLNVSPNRGAYTKVILDVDDETAYESGTDETNVLEATCPYATQAVADRVLSELTQYSFLYKPFEAIGCWTNPAVELTDSVTFTDTSVLRPVCARTINFGPAMVMDLTAPNDNDIDHEYAFESPTERNYKRTTARVINQLNVNEDGISLVSEKLNNIGGRNILLNSATVHWEAINSATVSYADGVSVSEWGCNDAIRATGTSGTTNIFLQFMYTSQTSAVYLSGRKYVMSCWIKNNSAGTIWLTANGGTSDEIAPGEQKRAVVYAEGDGSTALRMRLRYDRLNSAFDFTYWHPQIEYGEVATSWSPAPEDKVGNDEIIAKINVSPENITISANKVDLQGYVTFTNLSTSGQTAINGGNITTNTISADKLNITDLNAIGATIGGFKIETNSIHTNNVAITSNATNSVGLSSSTFTRTINGTSRSNLKLAIGSNFGVANDGTLYASNGNFTGTITSNSATITGGKLNINAVTTFNASDYTSADVTRIRDYILEGGIPTMDDYTKYDIDRNGRLNISDLIKVRDLVNGEASSFTATSYVDIDPSQSNSVIHIWSSGTGDTQGTFLGAGLIQTNTVRTGDCWMNTQGVWLGANNVRTGLLYPDSLNFFHSNGNNMMMLEGSSGLTFSDSSGNVTAQYPAYGPAIRSTKRLTSSSSVKITFSVESVAIISAIGYLGNAYGVFLYTGYALGSARQHITKLLGDAAVSMTINESDQSVTLSYTGAATMYVSVLPLYGNPPTFS